MVQEFQVLRCCQCETFQVHQVKKAKKWECKLCRQKQSYIKVFGQGSGADCRRHVQTLNMRRGEMSDLSAQAAIVSQDVRLDSDDRTATNEESSGPSSSRWQQYLADPEGGADGEEAYTDTLPQGAVFTTSRQQFDQNTSTQRKERRQRYKEQRREQQSGNWYRKQRPDYASQEPVDGYPDVGGQLGNRLQAKDNEAEVSTRPHLVPTNTQSQFTPLYNSPKSQKEVQVGLGVENRPVDSDNFVKKARGVSSNLNTKKIHDSVPSERRKPTIQVGSSKWAMFVDNSKEDETDSGEDSDEGFIHNPPVPNPTISNQFTDSDFPVSGNAKYNIGGARQEQCGPLSVHHVPSLKQPGDVPLFGTEDDLDDIISQM